MTADADLRFAARRRIVLFLNLPFDFLIEKLDRILTISSGEFSQCHCRGEVTQIAVGVLAFVG